MPKISRFVPLALALAGAMTAGHPAIAQNAYPDRPITMVIAYAAGGLTDILGRITAEKLGAVLGQTVVVENRPGASGDLGSRFVAEAAPDGYTILYTNSSMVFGAALGRTPPYDMFGDFQAVGQNAEAPVALFVSPTVPAETPAEFVSYLKAHPNTVTYGSASAGSINNLAANLFLLANDATGVSVSYGTGAGEMIPDLIAGRTQFSFMSIAQGLPYAQDGSLRPLAVSSGARSELMPDVPTLAETVMPDVTITSWNGIIVPNDTPHEIVTRLSDALREVMADPDMVAKMAAQGTDATFTMPDDFGALFHTELERWTKVVQDAGIVLEE